MQYQLVLQCSTVDVTERQFDELLDFEMKLDTTSDLYIVDGNDIGSGEFNIFILTNAPEAAFAAIRGKIPDINKWRVAYRRRDGEDYTVLYPHGLTEFTIL
ncbi:MAG: ABC transporter [Candidatus Eremiobacteraeota bacterium]|nr:ABC transporter [Candidatus Eremiobacteraeota bacterium]